MTLLYYDGILFAYHCRVPCVNLGGGRWIVHSPARDTSEEVLAGEAVVRLVRGGRYPLGEYRPIFGFGRVTAPQYAQIRSDAFAIAEVFGPAPVVPPMLVGDCAWLFSDPSLDSFGSPVPIELMSHAARIRAELSAGLIEEDMTQGRTWWSMDRVIGVDLGAWRQEEPLGSRPVPVSVTQEVGDQLMESRRLQAVETEVSSKECKAIGVKNARENE
jgi:hypothetical protein